MNSCKIYFLNLFYVIAQAVSHKVRNVKRKLTSQSPVLCNAEQKVGNIICQLHNNVAKGGESVLLIDQRQLRMCVFITYTQIFFLIESTLLQVNLPFLLKSRGPKHGTVPY